MGVTINGKVYGDVADGIKPKSFRGMPGRTGQFLRRDIPKQIYQDKDGKMSLMPGQFVTDDIIKRYNINPQYFVHPETMRLQGSFAFAHKHKGKFSVGIIRDMNGRGDVLMASVICKALKYQYGNAVTTKMCVKPGYESILFGNDYVDHIYTDRDLMDKEGEGVDIKLNVNDLEFKAELKMFEREQKIVKNRTTIYLEHLGLYLDNTTPHYFVTDSERVWAKQELERKDYNLNKPIIGIQLYGSNATRTYPNMWDVIHLLEDSGYQVLVLDGKNVGTDNYTYNLRQVGALVEQMTTTVTPNSYLFHLAGAMKKRAIALFGSCDGKIWVEDYEKVTAIDGKCPGSKNKCWWTMPCLSGDSLREKEKTHAPDCLAQIKPETILDEVTRQINEPKKVLVAVLTYNMSHLTKEMIDSIRSFHNYDILVIDNESSDDTIAWCESHNIKTIIRRQPVDEAWNMGLQATKEGGYDYLLLCNNDCILSSEYINTVVEVAERRQAFLVTGNVINKRDVQHNIGFQEMVKSVEVTQNVMVAGDYSALLISKDCIDKVGGFKYFAPRYQCDEDHMLRVRLFGKELVKTYATTFFHKHGAVVKSADFTEARRNSEWMEGVKNFKLEWGVDIYTDRNTLHSLSRIKDMNSDWKDKIYRKYK